MNGIDTLRFNFVVPLVTVLFSSQRYTSTWWISKAACLSKTKPFTREKKKKKTKIHTATSSRSFVPNHAFSIYAIYFEIQLRTLLSSRFKIYSCGGLLSSQMLPLASKYERSALMPNGNTNIQSNPFSLQFHQLAPLVGRIFSRRKRLYRAYLKQRAAIQLYAETLCT